MLYSPHYKMKEPESFDYYDVEDFNFNIEVIDGMLYALEQGGGGSTAIEHTITIPASGWDETEHTTTVTVEDVTDTSLVMLCIPMNISLSEFNDIYIGRINPIAVQNNTITLKAYGYPPTSDIHISFVIMNKR